MSNAEQGGVKGHAPLLEQTRKVAEQLGRHGTGVVSAVKGLERAIAEADQAPQRVVRAVEKALDALAELLDPALHPASILEGWRELATQARLETEANFREACAAKRWRLEGQWPEIYVERGIRVYLQEDGRVITVGPERMNDPTVTEIVEALIPQVEVLLPKDFSPTDFMEELAAAYDAISGPQVRQVAILDLYKSLVIRSQTSRFWKDARAAHFQGLSQDQFRARLSESLEQGVTECRDGRRIRLLPPLSTKDALFIYQSAEGRFGYVGRIDFIHPEGEEA